MPDHTDAAQAQQRTKVFISYARVDAAFADLLVDGLKSRGVEPLIDRSAIEHGEDWWTRIVELITDSAAVIFLISPQSVAPSSVCGKELTLIRKLNLRIVPVLFRVPPASVDMPGDLTSKDWIRCDEYGRRYEPASNAAIALKMAFENGAPAAEIERLEAALKSHADACRAETARAASWPERLAAIERALSLDDILWRREAGSWSARALAWDESGRPADLALRAGDIAAMRSWSNRRPANAIMPDAVQAYLEASEAFELEQSEERRRIIGRAFVKPARRALEEGRHDAALRLAAAGALLGDDLEMSLVPERGTEGLFRRAALQDRTRAVLQGHTASVRTAVFSADGARVLTASQDGTARIWDALSGAEIVCLQHENQVEMAAFSADGKRIVTASWDHTARIWDAVSGEELVCLEGRTYFKAAGFSSDGARIITISLDNTARIWDAARGDEIMSLQGHAEEVLSAAFSPDGARIVTTSRDRSAKIWDAVTGAELAQLKGHENVVQSARFGADGARIVTASADSTARIWDAATGAELACLRGHEKNVNSAFFSADGGRVVTASWDGTARVWDAGTGAELACLRGHDGSVTVAAFSPDGARVVSGSWDATARLWDARTGAEIARLSGHEVNWVNAAVFSPDGTRILTGSTDGTARVWDAAVSMEIARLYAGTAKTSADCARIAASSPDNCVRVWDVETGDVVACLKDADTALSPVAISDDHARIAVIGGDGVVRVLAVVTGALIGRLQWRGEQIGGAVFSADNARILTHSMAGENYFVQVWDVASGTQLASQSMWAHDDRFTCAALSPDGQRVVVSWTGPSPGVYDVNSGKPSRVLSGHGQGEMQSIAFSADSARIVTSSSDKTARVWDAATGAEIACLKHGDKVSSAAFSTDGTRVVTASDDRTARVWDAATGAELLCLKGHENWVFTAKFSADGGHIITTSWDKSVRIWDAASGAEIACLPGMESSVIDAAISRDAGCIVTRAENITRIWNGVRIAVLAGAAAPVLAASLTAGRGLCLGSEREDLLMQAAPTDLYAALMERLSEADRQEVLLRGEVLARPSHRNCYLPTDLQPVLQAERPEMPPVSAPLEALAVTAAQAKAADEPVVTPAATHEPPSIDRTNAQAHDARGAHHPLIAPALVIAVVGIGASVLFLLFRFGLLRVQ